MNRATTAITDLADTVAAAADNTNKRSKGRSTAMADIISNSSNDIPDPARSGAISNLALKITADIPAQIVAEDEAITDCEVWSTHVHHGGILLSCAFMNALL